MVTVLPGEIWTVGSATLVCDRVDPALLVSTLGHPRSVLNDSLGILRASIVPSSDTVADLDAGDGQEADITLRHGLRYWGLQPDPALVARAVEFLIDRGWRAHRNGTVRAAIRGVWDEEVGHSETLARFVAAAYWRPSLRPSLHEYIVREKVPEALFLDLFDVVTGPDCRMGKAFGRWWRYHDWEGWTYWTMGAGRERTTIINRRWTADIGG